MRFSTVEPVIQLFLSCTKAMHDGVPARKRSARDKEFFFQDWVRDRLEETGLAFDEGGRNSYPDLVLVHHAQGYEVKGLATPGRDKNYDCNSQIPTGLHNGRDIFYVFGRYPSETEDLEVPISDLVIVHGDFLDAQHDYVHKNSSIRGFGTYGDMLLRDRKMYVAPTPYALLTGLIGRRTLVVPADGAQEAENLVQVGDITRMEADQMLVAYSFDLLLNTLEGVWADNPNAGTPHEFSALRHVDDSPDVVELQ